MVVFANVKSFDKCFICLPCKQGKITDHEITHVMSWEPLTAVSINCILNL